MNKSFSEIKNMYDKLYSMECDIREMIRMNISKTLMNTSEDNKLVCNIALDTRDCFGLSTNDMIKIVAMWQHPSEGWIDFDVYGYGVKSFDEMTTEELMIIITELNK
jgi:hypothetical protein